MVFTELLVLLQIVMLCTLVKLAGLYANASPNTTALFVVITPRGSVRSGSRGGGIFDGEEFVATLILPKGFP